MGRHCAECNYFLDRSRFSSNQWRKGDGVSRCVGCVEGRCVYYKCYECERVFDNQNELKMHTQVHRPRDVACPVCGDRRFRSGANAVQHVESGYCRGCRGANNARRQIYDFASQQNGMQRYMTERPLLTNGASQHHGGGVPDHPYRCPECSRAFRQLSQLMQHRDQKHGNYRMLEY